MTAAPRRGEIWLADIPNDKQRPVIVLTRDPMGRLLHSVICAPITSTIRGITTEVPIGTESGLNNGSVVNLDNTLLLSRTLLIRPIGRAPEQVMQEACRALMKAVACGS